MICKVCDIDNLEDSKFCIECGASTNNGKERDRIVSAEEMKNYLWSFDFSKVRDKGELNRMIRTEMQKWRQDPHYIPIISAPTKRDRGIMHIQAPDDDKALETLKKEWEEQKRDMGFDAMIGKDAPYFSSIRSKSCGCKNATFVYDHRSPIPKSCAVCLWQNPNHPDNEQKYTAEERLLKNYYDATHDNIPCGVCGDMRCNIKHIPTIQQQYQEAFENIQMFRRNRLARYLGGIKISDELWFSHLLHEDVFGKPKSRITGTDVRKGIRSRKHKPPFPKFKSDNSRTVKKGRLPRRRAIHPEKVEY